MKKVLMIAHQFPPAGGPGVQRTSKFVKYMGEFGWKPTVLTRDNRNMPVKDNSLSKDIPHDTKIIRTSAWDVNSYPGLFGIAGKILGRKVLIPDSERLWQIFGSKKALQEALENNIDLIYTTSMPYSSHLMGLYLKERLPHIPWVADFRDEWTRNPYILDNPYNSIRMNIERSMEKKVLRKADALITNTPVMLDNFLKYNNDLNLKGDFFVIPNGFDPDDFNITNKPERLDDKFTITYTGSFYGRRKPDTFTKALGLCIKNKLIERDKVLVKLIGSFKQDYIDSLVDKYELNGVVETSGYVPHEECVRMMTSSDCLLLIEGGGLGAEAFYTGKVFEYMATTRPILAVIPEKGAAADLIRRTGTGLISNFDDVDKTIENITKLYTSWSKGDKLLHPNFEEIRKYDRRALTKNLTEVFEHSLKK